MTIRLPLPDLDDLRWQTLVDEGRALIPAYAPGWTDHNAGDPGITLLELFAYLAELDLYTLGQIGPGHLRKLLALAGITPAPPRPARAVVELTLRAGATNRDVPAGTPVEGHDPLGDAVPFRTVHPVTVQPGRLAVVSAGDFVDVTARQPIAVFGDDPDIGSVMHLGLDLPSELPAGSNLTFGAVPARTTPPALDGSGHHSVRLVWEQLTAGGTWARVPAEDGTRALTAEGRVTLRLDWPLTARTLPGREGPRLGWLRARIADGRHDCAPSLLGLAYNAAEVVQAEPGPPLAYEGTGGPQQRLEIPDAPVVAESLRITGDGTDWRIVTDFLASGRSDAHATVDPVAGTVTFGDGEHGRVPPAGETLTVTADRTVAARGNLGAGAVDGNADADVTARNVTPATGGRDAETVGQAAARARADREASMRAVTLDDHVALALSTPGTEVARGQAFANRHPAFGCLNAPGVVTVVVLPSLPLGHPAPTAGLRRAVGVHLASRRIVGTRIEVAAPQYTQVSVRATVAARRETSGATVPAAVSAALDAFFDPLTGGPQGTGWPFGRDVYRAEVLAVVDRVPGVAHVLSLELVSGGATCGDLCVGPFGLVLSGPHETAVR